MQLDGVPDRVSWTTVRDFLQALGLPLDQIGADGIRIGWNALEVDVFATDAAGNRYVVEDDPDRIAMHRVCIEIVHDEQRQGSIDGARPSEIEAP